MNDFNEKDPMNEEHSEETQAYEPPTEPDWTLGEQEADDPAAAQEAFASEGKPEEPVMRPIDQPVTQNENPFTPPPVQPSYQNQSGYGYPQQGSGYYNPMPQNGMSPSVQSNQSEQHPYHYAVPEMELKTKPKKKRKGLIVAVIVIAVILIGGLATMAVLLGDRETEKPEEAPTSASDQAGLQIQEQPVGGILSENGMLTTEEVAEKVSPSVVGVIAYAANNAGGEGSGIIMGEDETGTKTYVITCAHVIKGAKKMEIQLSDGERYAAKKVGADDKTDLAVIAVEKTGLPAATFGDSDALNRGQTVVAIGNPGGTEFFGSITQGVVSGVDRPINSQIGYSMKCIQHDAAINPGNSGGALVNLYGQVVGINSSKIYGESFESMGFAIPISAAKEIVDSLIQDGYIANRVKLGIEFIPAMSDLQTAAKAYMAELPSGALVIQSIQKDSDLKNTKAKVGDFIIGVNGKEMEDTSILLEEIEASKAGDSITLKLCRIDDSYQKQEFSVTCKLVVDKG